MLRVEFFSKVDREVLTNRGTKINYLVCPLSWNNKLCRLQFCRQRLHRY